MCINKFLINSKKEWKKWCLTYLSNIPFEKVNEPKSYPFVVCLVVSMKSCTNYINVYLKEDFGIEQSKQGDNEATCLDLRYVHQNAIKFYRHLRSANYTENEALELADHVFNTPIEELHEEAKRGILFKDIKIIKSNEIHRL